MFQFPQTNPGFNNTPFKFTKYSNAYMLVYIRWADKDKVICNVDEKDIAEHLQIRLKKEQEEKERRRKEKAEAHLYTIIKVARDEDLAFQIGKEIHFDLVDHDKVRSFRIQKQTLFSQFKVRNWLQLPILCLFEDTCKLLFLSHHLHHSCLFYHSQVQDFFLPLEEEGLSSPV
jgi:ubiquitin carboxyl-terminal hydrolase 7